MIGMAATVAVVANNTVRVGDSLNGLTSPPPPLAPDVPDTAAVLATLDTSHAASVVNSIFSFSTATTELTKATPLTTPISSLEAFKIHSEPFPHLEGLGNPAPSAEVELVRASAPTAGEISFGEAAKDWFLRSAATDLAIGVAKEIMAEPFTVRSELSAARKEQEQHAGYQLAP